MKRKLNILLAGLIVGLIGTAYATTCYLHQVVLCLGVGDVAAGTSANCGSYTSSVNVYADVNAYKWGIHSVTRGGYNSTTYTGYCDSNSNSPDSVNGIFEVYWFDPCSGVEQFNSNCGTCMFLSHYTYTDNNSVQCN
jgi:hypothetical protein